MSAQLRRLILPFLFVLAVVPALGQAYSTSTKQTRRIYTDKANGFTLDADIDFRDGRASNPNKVKVKYTYNGPLLIEDRYAVWKMRYLDGADQLQERQFSAPVGGTEIRGVLTDAPVHQTSVIDEPFDCKQIVSICFDLETSRTAKTGVFASTQSIAPDSVSGPRALLPGQQVTLTVMGGALARGGKWVWYEGTCGGSRVGTGRSLTLTPTANTTYYVRAEPQMGAGACLAATVRVDDRSVAPVNITGASQACAGEPLTLQVAGGGLGLDARWVWYTGKCGGSDAARVGTGAALNIRPTQATTYFVRAEGKLNTTACAEVLVTPYERAPAPTSIKAAGLTTVCAGANVSLRVEGAALPRGAQWKWYSGNCDGASLGTGPTLTVAPTATTVYYVRAEGGCNNSSCAQLSVDVVSPSQAAYGISAPASVAKKQEFTMTVQGGQLGHKAEWKWYAQSCGGKLLGVGEAIKVRLRQPTVVFVKAVSPCGETSCASVRVETQARQMARRFKDGGLMHYGYGFGLDYQRFTSLVPRTPRDSVSAAATGLLPDTVERRFSGFGIRGEFTYHPIFKENISVMLRPSAALGTGLYGLLSDTASDKGKRRVSYYDVALTAELAVGHRRCRLLLTQENRLREFRYRETGALLMADQRERRFLTKLGAGLRIGAYAGAGKSSQGGNNLDLTAFLLNTTATLTDQPLYADLGVWRPGWGVMWWIHNSVGIHYEHTIGAPVRAYDLLGSNGTPALVRLSITLKNDFFY